MQYQRQPAIVDPLQVARIFGHRMQEVFITSARAKITEFYTDEEAEVTKLARHWKTVKQHAKTLLDPLLFSTETCPICTEQFSPVDSYYLWPQIAPKCPLAPGSSACGNRLWLSKRTLYSLKTTLANWFGSLLVLALLKSIPPPLKA